jgi:hypothetical protein
LDFNITQTAEASEKSPDLKKGHRDGCLEIWDYDGERKRIADKLLLFLFG